MLRVSVGAFAILEAGLAVIEGQSLLNLAAASVAAPAGLALIIGLLTPVASAVLAAGGTAILLGLHAAVLRRLDSHMVLLFAQLIHRTG